MMINTSILSILNSYVKSGDLAAVVYNSPTKVNVDLDTTAHPVAVLYTFRDGTINLQGGTKTESADVNLMFLTHQPQLDFDAAQNDVLLDAMADIAERFIADVIAADFAEFAGNEVTVRGIYDFDDKNTTGVALQFRLRSHPQCFNV